MIKTPRHSTDHLINGTNFNHDKIHYTEPNRTRKSPNFYLIFFSRSTDEGAKYLSDALKSGNCKLTQLNNERIIKRICERYVITIALWIQSPCT
jgi:hypothetical protein